MRRVNQRHLIDMGNEPAGALNGIELAGLHGMHRQSVRQVLAGRPCRGLIAQPCDQLHIHGSCNLGIGGSTQRLGMPLVAEADPAVAVHLQQLARSLQRCDDIRGTSRTGPQRLGEDGPHRQGSTTDLGQCERTQRFDIRALGQVVPHSLFGTARLQCHDQVIVCESGIWQAPFDSDFETAANGQFIGEPVHHALRFRGAPSAARTVSVDDDDQPATERRVFKFEPPVRPLLRQTGEPSSRHDPIDEVLTGQSGGIHEHRFAAGLTQSQQCLCPSGPRRAGQLGHSLGPAVRPLQELGQGLLGCNRRRGCLTAHR